MFHDTKKTSNFGVSTQILLIMDKNEFKSSECVSALHNAERCFALPVAAGQYIAPDIEVVDIELTQNILQPSNGRGNAPDNFGGEDW